ncbi:MAG TPA: F0F1 ATP synthase subunit epsilon [Massilia sp.]|jgi:F-type H+-transporting ATPase subunit epsilon|nr:F0F1 ATP synthase subunit epsilon [Massilia sp.]
MADPKTLQVDVVSPEEEIFSGVAEFVALPGEVGELGIFPLHTPLLTRIRPGAVRIKLAGRDEEELVFVAGGIVDVHPDGVTVLADTAIRGRDLDEARANEARKRAQEMLNNSTAEFDHAKAQSELAIAIAQLHALARLRERR